MGNFFKVNWLKTIYFNHRVFKFKTACKLPIVVGWHFKIRQIHKGTVEIKGKPKLGMIKLGCGEGVFGVEANKHSYWIVKKTAKVIFNGASGFSKGVSIRGGDNSIIEFGQGVHFNQNFFIAANTVIKIGDNVIGGWDVHLQDADGHQIFNSESEENQVERCPITIGNHVWIGYSAHLLKGSYIDEDSVVACKALVTKSFEGQKNVLVGGFPAKIIKENINWKL